MEQIKNLLMKKYLKEKGTLTYFDYLYYLRNMLKKDAGEGGELIRYINNRHSYFLIDEFQDTDPVQYDYIAQSIGNVGE